MAKFEKVNRFKDVDLVMPERKTAASAGYDFEIAEDVELPSYSSLMSTLINKSWGQNTFTLEALSALTKDSKAKPTLVSTGMKCNLANDEYLELSVRSSCPLKNWIILANGVGIIDADYYNNPDNEGEIYFQLINLSPFNIKLKKGDRIGQGIIKKYICTEDDRATGQRQGGFGSTSEALQKTAKAWQQIGFSTEEATKALDSLTTSLYTIKEIDEDRGLRATMSIYDETMGAGEAIPIDINSISVTTENVSCIDTLGNKICDLTKLEKAVNINVVDSEVTGNAFKTLLSRMRNEGIDNVE